MNRFTGNTSCKAVWRFEPGNLSTDSKGSNSLTAIGSPAVDTTNFKEGSASISLSTSNVYKLLNADVDSMPMETGDTDKLVTICGWVRPTTLGAWQFIFGKTSYYFSGRIGFGVSINNGAVHIHWGGSSDQSIGKTLSINNWYHISASADGVNKTFHCRIYDVTLNTVTDYNGTPSSTMGVGPAEFRIGWWPDNAGGCFNGQIDEVVVFDSVLYSSEMDKIRNGVFCDSVAAGVFDFSGESITLLQNRIFPVSSTSYTILGQSVNLLFPEYILRGDAGVYDISSPSINLKHDKFISSSPWSVEVTGTDVNFVTPLIYTVSSGFFELTGGDANFKTPYIIQLYPGVFDINGQEVDFLSPYVLTCGSPTYEVSAPDINLKNDKLLQVQNGSFGIGGSILFGFVPTDGAIPGIIVYICTLTGSQDATTDVEIPISSFQARLRTADPTYLSVVVPGFDYADRINNRPNGIIKIDVAYRVSGVDTKRETVIQVDLEDIRLDEGTSSKSITLTGHKQKTYSNKSITLYNPTYKNLLNGAIRYRFADPNIYLWPGDTVTVGTDVFVVNNISYNVGISAGNIQTSMEIAE